MRSRQFQLLNGRRPERLFPTTVGAGAAAVELAHPIIAHRRRSHFSFCGQSFPPILKEVNFRRYLDSATAQPHIYNHDVDEEEVEEVLMNPGEDRPGRDGSRVELVRRRAVDT